MMYGITFKIIQVQEKKVWTCRSIAETRLSELLKLGWRLEIQYTLLSRPLCTSEIVYNNKTRNQNQRLPKANAINIKQTNKTKPKQHMRLALNLKSSNPSLCEHIRGKGWGWRKTKSSVQSGVNPPLINASSCF